MKTLRISVGFGVALAATLLTLRPAAHGAVAHEIHLTARKFEYSPNVITVKKGEPVVLELDSLDRRHGFTIPELKIRADAKPGGKTIVRFTPDKAGRFDFHCDVFCGSGHEGMAGTLVVVD